MKLDLRTPEEQAYARMQLSGERHQLHWIIRNGTLTPSLTCLHGNLPAGRSCAAEILADHPELLTDGYQGNSDEARDGIIVSRWRHAPCRWSCLEDDGPEFLWNYEDGVAAGSVATQRHTVRFVIGAESIDPVFECLHEGGGDCDAEFWRGDLWLFPEWHAGPDSPARAGTIVSWWAAGQPNNNELPHWAYEEHAREAIQKTIHHFPESRSA